MGSREATARKRSKTTTSYNTAKKLEAKKMKVAQERRPNLFTATTVMERYFDEYDYYNFDRKYTEPQCRKGRSKKESEQNTNRHNPAGHERKVAQKFQNADKNKKEKGEH